jgi:hypothetical protein
LAQQDARSHSRHHDRELPVNIQIAPELAGVVAHMLQTSETFRRQCRAIASVRQLRVEVQVDDEVSVPASCDMSRYEFGAMKAVVRIGSRDRAIELIAHEFEHVAEFAERVEYRWIALRRPSAVWAASDGRFETARAIEAGLRVEREVMVGPARLASKGRQSHVP